MAKRQESCRLTAIARIALGLTCVFLWGMSIVNVLMGRWAIGGLLLGLGPSWVVVLALERCRRQVLASGSQHYPSAQLGEGCQKTPRRFMHPLLLDILLTLPAFGLFVTSCYLGLRGAYIPSMYFAFLFSQALMVAQVITYFCVLHRRLGNRVSDTESPASEAADSHPNRNAAAE